MRTSLLLGVAALSLCIGCGNDETEPRVDLPEGVAGCDCLYHIQMQVEAPALDAIRVYRRWDDLNEPNDPVLIETQVVTGG